MGILFRRHRQQMSIVTLQFSGVTSLAAQAPS